MPPKRTESIIYVLIVLLMLLYSGAVLICLEYPSKHVRLH